MKEIIFTSSVTTILIAILLWLFRTWIKERIEADIRLENDSKLEKLKSQLQKTNENLNNITSAGGHAYSQSQVNLLPYKIKAIETVWSSVIAWNEMTVASMFVANTPLSWVRRYGSDPSTKKNVDQLLQKDNYFKFCKERNDTELVRPFISDRGWALYYAYNSFYLSRILKAGVLRIPTLNHVEIWENINERNLIKASAPDHIIELYDSNITDGTTAFLKYLQEEILKEFKIELSGARDSKSAASNTAKILKEAEDLVKNAKQQTKTSKNEPME